MNSVIYAELLSGEDLPEISELLDQVSKQSDRELNMERVDKRLSISKSQAIKLFLKFLRDRSDARKLDGISDEETDDPYHDYEEEELSSGFESLERLTVKIEKSKIYWDTKKETL